MNPVTFNDPFNEFISYCGKAGNVSAQFLRDAKQELVKAPLFVHTIGKHVPGRQRLESGGANVMLFEPDGPARLPFPTIRGAIRRTDAGLTKVFFVASNGEGLLFGKPGELRAKKTIIMLRVEDAKEPMINRFLLVLNCRMKQEGPANTDGTRDVLITAKVFDRRRNFREVTREVPDNFRFGVGKDGVAALLLMLDAIEAPDNHVARVRPPSLGRSVEWVHAREHYVILDRDHPANAANVARGSKVSDTAEKALERQAHNRRAHDRTYRHPRYVNARGKTVRIASVWIGPKEWEDAGSGQIYTIQKPDSQWTPKLS